MGYNVCVRPANKASGPLVLNLKNILLSTEGTFESDWLASSKFKARLCTYIEFRNFISDTIDFPFPRKCLNNNVYFLQPLYYIAINFLFTISQHQNNLQALDDMLYTMISLNLHVTILLVSNGGARPHHPPMKFMRSVSFLYN